LRSKKRSKITNGKQQLEEPPVFFLDRTFGRTELATVLRSAGFLIVTLFDEYGEAEVKIADPVMIRDCGLKERVLLTGDQDLVSTWAKEIIEARIAVFVTTNNNEGPKQWAPRIIQAREDILRELRRRVKPFTARIATNGRITQVRIYDDSLWKKIEIGKKHGPHRSRYKPDSKANPETA
jgi:hypothetical protein